MEDRRSKVGMRGGSRVSDSVGELKARRYSPAHRWMDAAPTPVLGAQDPASVLCRGSAYICPAGAVGPTDEGQNRGSAALSLLRGLHASAGRHTNSRHSGVRAHQTPRPFHSRAAAQTVRHLPLHSECQGVSRDVCVNISVYMWKNVCVCTEVYSTVQKS